MATADRTPKSVFVNDFAERDWPADDERWTMLRDALAHIEDLHDVESDRWGEQQTASEVGRAVMQLVNHLLPAFDIAASGYIDFRDYANARVAAEKITTELDALVRAEVVAPIMRAAS